MINVAKPIQRQTTGKNSKTTVFSQTNLSSQQPQQPTPTEKIHTPGYALLKHATLLNAPARLKM